ncbi:hypothetical protein AB1Y20_018229 [Prymnesium parvum]|uniref:Endothelin-converting enzyme 1 n=1 Tax=Prymnesium parvum TaxID=97485 RepID=A0AB34JNN3_PRYPA
MAEGAACPCCSNPWAQPAGSYLLACSTCTEDDKGVAGIDHTNFDTSTAPSSNFYQHANGNWMATHPIPPEYPAWNTFISLHDTNLGRLKDLLEALPPPPAGAATTDEEKVAAYWSSVMDEAAIEAAGLAPLQPVLDACDLAATDKTAAIAALHAQFGVNVLFAATEGPDDKKSEWTLLQLQQAGLGLPDRDYYFDEDKADKRKLYEEHVAQMLTLAGEEEGAASAQAAAVLKLETSLAGAHMTRAERRDPDSVYNKMSCAKLAALVKGGIDWKRYLELIGKPAPSAVNCDSPPALAAASRLLESSSAEEMRAYLRWHAIHSCAKHLPQKFVDCDFEFYAKALQGQKEQKPRWKRAMGFIEQALGEAIGKIYVSKYFAEDAKKRALETVECVRQALEKRLNEVEWMGASTRQRAIEKMNEFRVKIGYPDEWIDYSKLQVVQGDHLGNVLRSRAFEHAREMGFADAPTDRSRWLMLPQQINAYYHPNLNEIVFPAAILQPPFFDAEADDAVNFGAMGAVVGHEMTHGFDDQGRQYDHKGNLNDWWEPADAAEYERRAAVQVEQASKFKVHDKELNGKLTCGENIADLGGLKLSYSALLAKLEKQQAPPALINGLTPKQRFFLSWAQVWRENTTKERSLQLVTIDPHGPNEYRVNGPLSNMREFHEAFSVAEGDRMYLPPEDRVDIW